MLYQYTKRYLKKTLGKPSKDLQWSTIDNVQFFNYIDARYTIKEFNKEVSEVKEAFRDFFEPVGKIVFKYKEESSIKFKVFPYSVNPKSSKHLQNIIKIIKNNRKYIEYPYQGQNDQIAIKGKIRREINREIYGSDESVNAKELIKYSIRQALELEQRDIITTLKRIYIVKIFQKNRVLKSEVKEPEKRLGIKNRYNGYTPTQIEEIYKEVFIRSNVNIENFLQEVMKKEFQNKLNFSEITNAYYEKNVLKIIHASIAQEIADYVSIEEDFLLGISGYLMRKYFKDIHELMAIELIEKIYDQDMNANRFLSHYDGSTVLSNNKKYKVPSLETQDGQQWNSTSLIGICNLWMNIKRKKERYEYKLVETNHTIVKLEKSLNHVTPEIESLKKKLLLVEEKFLKINKSHNEITANLKYLEATNLNSNEYFSSKEKFIQSEAQLMQVDAEKKRIREKIEAIKNANITTYQELEFLHTQKSQLSHDLKVQELNINSKNSQIDPIIDSIVRVLMARTKAVEE